jgi:hypothetical protein
MASGERAGAIRIWTSLQGKEDYPTMIEDCVFSYTCGQTIAMFIDLGCAEGSRRESLYDRWRGYVRSLSFEEDWLSIHNWDRTSCIILRLLSYCDPPLCR